LLPLPKKDDRPLRDVLPVELPERDGDGERRVDMPPNCDVFREPLLPCLEPDHCEPEVRSELDPPVSNSGRRGWDHDDWVVPCIPVPRPPKLPKLEEDPVWPRPLERRAPNAPEELPRRNPLPDATTGLPASRIPEAVCGYVLVVLVAEWLEWDLECAEELVCFVACFFVCFFVRFVVCFFACFLPRLETARFVLRCVFFVERFVLLLPADFFAPDERERRVFEAVLAKRTA
jgi:hypothetical protein